MKSENFNMSCELFVFRFESLIDFFAVCGGDYGIIDYAH